MSQNGTTEQGITPALKNTMERQVLAVIARYPGIQGNQIDIQGNGIYVILGRLARKGYLRRVPLNSSPYGPKRLYVTTKGQRWLNEE